MKIEANDKDIRDVFKLGYFKIPRFQRPYSWEKDEVENFWNDITKNNSPEYFIGSMVVYQDSKPYFGIVDGQQRLTTITLVLSAIRDAFIHLNQDDLAKGVHQYVEQPNIDNKNEFVLHSETSFPYLQNHIQSYKEQKIDLEVGSEEQKLKNAFELITKKLTEFAGLQEVTSLQLELMPTDKDPLSLLKRLRDKILSLKLVFIQLDNEDDAYLIFETLNARGRDLKSSDLVKNLLLKTIKNNSVSIDRPKQAWVSLVNKFDDIGETDALDNFILHYWISKQSYCTEKELFSKVKEHITSMEKADALLSDFENYGKLYCKMLHPNFFDWDNNEGSQSIKDSLIALNRFKVKQQSSFVLAALAAYEKKLFSLKVLKLTLKRVEYFHFIFNAITSQRSSGHIVSTYSKNAIKLSKANTSDEANIVVKELFKTLSSKIPHYEEFEVKFLELIFLKSRTKDRNIIKYCLNRLLPNTTSCFDIRSDALTIEHIVPQSDTNLSPELIGSIGNLLLVDQSTNAEKLRDKCLNDKLDYLRKSNYPLENNFLTDQFDGKAGSIEKRTKEIAKYLFENSRVS
ncbi:DUF262 domain-containing protein [Alteromonas macleodii]|uniref:DUF262 domain-containing protein n=1 Tax=Alteromonas macleodii TaxID=28108 RepID=A0A6T9Y7Q2_ALTMA|nr:DUF262 domain-containing protein [Alteromonas macleodii]CAB9495348.1 conserved protein of unknown function [Alteromonas macleodii]